MDDHPFFKALPGDRVVFSSRMIPGNEKAIHRIINHLYRRGATVVLDPPHAVHASGHACREEQKLLINLVQPDTFVPIHGEYRHLAEHASLAEDLGVADVILLETGDVLTVWDDDFELTGRVPSGHVLVDGKATDDAPSVALQDRRKLARSGIVVAWLVLDVNSGEVISGPELMVQGVVGLEDREALISEASRYALAEVSKLNRESRREPAEVGETLRLAVRRVFNRRIERKPVVVPIVHEL
jgi:ribonuclease J